MNGFTSLLGSGSGPTLYKNSLLVAVDCKSGNSLTSLDKKTGEIKWQTPRPNKDSYVTPVVFNVGGKDEALLPAEMSSPATTRARASSSGQSQGRRK